MSLNLSSTSNSSLDSSLYICLDSPVTVLITILFSITKVVLTCPLSSFLLYLGHQRWRQQRSFATTSHSDVFTYHQAAMDLFWVLGFGLYFCSSSIELMRVASFFVSVPFTGETFLHVLTCVERYLAVVHPVTYLGLRTARGVRIRNISIGCVWLLSLTWAAVLGFTFPSFPIVPFFLFLIFSLVVVSCCSLSVLLVLIRPGPGEGGRDKEPADQSKKRAFATIMAIMAVLWLWFGALLVTIVLTVLELDPIVLCVVKASLFWVNLPCSLVLPLLYLHKAGKLPCSYSG